MGGEYVVVEPESADEWIRESQSRGIPTPSNEIRISRLAHPRTPLALTSRSGTRLITELDSFSERTLFEDEETKQRAERS